MSLKIKKEENVNSSNNIELSHDCITFITTIDKELRMTFSEDF
jgi:hypothetical protein